MRCSIFWREQLSIDEEVDHGVVAGERLDLAVAD
jgi:hypothetical protein